VHQGQLQNNMDSVMLWACCRRKLLHIRSKWSPSLYGCGENKSSTQMRTNGINGVIQDQRGGEIIQD